MVLLVNALEAFTDKKHMYFELIDGFVSRFGGGMLVTMGSVL